MLHCVGALRHGHYWMDALMCFLVKSSNTWQEGVFYSLCAAYSLIGAVAMIQLVRIEIRVPEYGWTIQKVFHMMNFIVSAARALDFGFYQSVFSFKVKDHSFGGSRALVFLNLLSTCSFLGRNLLPGTEYANKQTTSWIPLNKWCDIFYTVMQIMARMYLAVVSCSAAFGFALYGGRLFLMLRRLPLESKGHHRKLQEVGFITAICFSCFLIRTIVVALSVFNVVADLDVLDHPLLKLIFYMVVEILPSGMVLFILRKLPPKRMSAPYQLIG